jgi:hypothetical protein
MTGDGRGHDAARPKRRPGAEPLARRDLACPHEDRLSCDDPHREEILAAHAVALEQDQAGYLDPATGLFVLSSAYLADRGYCCAQGCRHCPYLE